MGNTHMLYTGIHSGTPTHIQNTFFLKERKDEFQDKSKIVLKVSLKKKKKKKKQLRRWELLQIVPYYVDECTIWKV